jgi:hypothetical protein
LFLLAVAIPSWRGVITVRGHLLSPVPVSILPPVTVTVTDIVTVTVTVPPIPISIPAPPPVAATVTVDIAIARVCVGRSVVTVTVPVVIPLIIPPPPAVHQALTAGKEGSDRKSEGTEKRMIGDEYDCISNDNVEIELMVTYSCF